MGVTFQKPPCGRRFLKCKRCVFNLFPWNVWALVSASAQGITWFPEGSRDFARDLKIAKSETNMAARGKLCKTLFPPSLVSCLHYRSFLPSKTSIPQAISKQETFIYWVITRRMQGGEIGVEFLQLGIFLFNLSKICSTGFFTISPFLLLWVIKRF